MYLPTPFSGENTIESPRRRNILFLLFYFHFIGMVLPKFQCNYLITKESKKLNKNYLISKREVDIHKSRQWGQKHKLELE